VNNCGDDSTFLLTVPMSPQERGGTGPKMWIPGSGLMGGHLRVSRAK
jgi:hypothetical protein